MTGESPVLDRPALRAALSHMQIEEPGTGRRFEEVLAERNDWPLPLAERVADEYCGFLYLAATAGFEVTPSEAVDQAWHLHLEWPHYREILCGKILGRPLDHRPGTGEPDDKLRCRRQYEETLALYERTFDKTPPPDIWPRPGAFDDEAAAALRRTRRRNLALAGAMTVFAAAAATQTPTLIDLFIAMAVVGMILALVVVPGVDRGREGEMQAMAGAAAAAAVPATAAPPAAAGAAEAAAAAIKPWEQKENASPCR